MGTLAGNEQQLLVPQGLPCTESSPSTYPDRLSAGCPKSALVGVSGPPRSAGLEQGHRRRPPGVRGQARSRSNSSRRVIRRVTADLSSIPPCRVTLAIRGQSAWMYTHTCNSGARHRGDPSDTFRRASRATRRLKRQPRRPDPAGAVHYVHRIDSKPSRHGARLVARLGFAGLDCSGLTHDRNGRYW